MKNRSCDVVIATRNRADSLRRCLDGLRQQSIATFGVIVVDDSSDRPLTTELDSSDLTGLDVTLITLAQPSGPATGRNAGVAASTAEFIVFIDDDVFPSRYFLETHLDAVSAASDDHAPIVSCGPFVQPADWVPTPWNLWEAQQMKKEADNLLSGAFDISWRQFHTGNNCVPRIVFNELGGFDDAFKRAEDDEFGLRLHKRGCVFTFESEAIAWHYSNRSLEAWLAIPRSYARYDVEIDNQNPEIGYLERKKFELRRRRLPQRAARVLFGRGRRNRLGVTLSVAAAKLLYRLGLVQPSMGALSVAYDLSYVDSLRVSERAHRRGSEREC